MKLVIRLTLLSLVLVLVFGVAMAQEDYKILRVRNGTDDTPGLDPGVVTDTSSIQTLMLTMPGLTVLAEEDGAALPGLAESWDVVENEDGTVTYTFHLIPEIPWVRYDPDAGEVVEVTDENGDVRYVTAHDHFYGMMRTLNPETAGEYAYVLYGRVQGATEYYNGEGSAEDVGIQVIDDYTLAITARFMFGADPAIFGMWMARPVPQWAIEEYAEFWQEPGNNQTYGPYVLKEWVHNEYMTVVKNPFWPGTEYIPVPAIDEIQLYFVDQSVGLAMFEAGDLDHLDTVPPADLDRIRADPELSQQLHIFGGVCSYYYGFNTRDEPFNNVHLRRAFSYAIDREAVVDNITRAGQIPAQWFTIPSMPAAPTLERFPDLGIWFDPDMAQEELQLYLDEMGYASVGEIPDIALLYNTNETHRAIAEAIQQMWVETLGIEVQLTNQEFAVYLDSRPNFPVWRAGWCNDYPDAHNFIGDVFYSTSENNDTWWANEEFDALIDEAMVLTDVAARQELYARAEEILVLEDAAITPIYWYVQVEMTKPYVERTFFLADNQENYINWDINR